LEWIALLLGAGAALLGVGAKVGSWWRNRGAAKEKARLEALNERTELERDVEQGRADVAEAKAGVLSDHVVRQRIGANTAEEVMNVARTAEPTGQGDLDSDNRPLRDVADLRLDAVEQWVRDRHDGAAGEAARSREAPGLRKLPAPPPVKPAGKP
jgi:hypothetical protein